MIFDRYIRTQSLRQLKALFNDKAIGAEQCVHLGVDIQRAYAVEETSEHIAQVIAPAFRQASIPHYWIHFSPRVNYADMPVGELRFSCVEPDVALGDRIVRKFAPSAFDERSYLHSDKENFVLHMEAQDKKLMLVSGFAYECCVIKTALDARSQGYETLILSDGVVGHTGSKTYKSLREAGVLFAPSKDVLKALKIG